MCYLHTILHNIFIMHDSTSLSELNIIECLSNNNNMEQLIVSTLTLQLHTSYVYVYVFLYFYYVYITFLF